VTAREEMARLSARLGLMDEQQDWGIVNGDGRRSDEFIRVYHSEPLTAVQRVAMAQLLLASANERLAADPDADLGDFADLLPRIVADADWEYHYWRGLTGDEFPVAAWLRSQ
jgi:hypothetical protein